MSANPSSSAFLLRSRTPVSVPVPRAVLASPAAARRRFWPVSAHTRAEVGRRGGVATMVAAVVAAGFSFSARCSSAKAGVGASREEEFVRKTIADNVIVIFSKSWCPYCARAKAVFDKLEKVPHVVELDERDDGDDIQDALEDILGRRTVPQVFVNGKHIGGSDDTFEAYENGYLVKALAGQI